MCVVDDGVRADLSRPLFWTADRHVDLSVVVVVSWPFLLCVPHNCPFVVFEDETLTDVGL